MYKTLEHHEHAEHIAHAAHAEGEHGAAHDGAHASAAKWTALLVAVLAAGLAICEQGAKHAEIKVQKLGIDAADSWAQYQAKSIRSTVARDVALVITSLETGSSPASVAKREAVLEGLKRDQERYDNDPKDGREAIAHKAHELEHERDHALEQTHAYHNGSAAFELGIVLATASAIIGSKLLLRISAGLGIAAVVFSLLGWLAPEYGAF